MALKSRVQGQETQSLPFVGWMPPAATNGPHGSWVQGWRKRRDAKANAYLAAKVYRLEPMRGRVRLTATFTFPQKRRRDMDGLMARLKGVIDGIVQAGVLEDDDMAHLEIRVVERVVPHTTRLDIVLEPCGGAAGEEG